MQYDEEISRGEGEGSERGEKGDGEDQTIRGEEDGNSGGGD